MADRADIQRLLGDVVRIGRVASVDHQRARCTVAVGNLTSGAVPWLTHRAGATRCWSPPSVGEQVLLISPEGDIAAAVALRGIYSSANPAPASAEKLEHFEMPDGSVFSYDAAAKHLAVTLVDGATAAIVAPGGLDITGPVTIDGPLLVTDDVTVIGGLAASADIVAGGVSLHDHVHGQVKAGSDMSGAPA